MTTGRPRAAISWSGGKDSCTALHRAWPAFDVVAMVTMFDDEGARSRSHGLTRDVVEAQARRLGVRSVIGRGSWQTYDAGFSEALRTLAGDGITHVIFGDILFEEHRLWSERICAAAGLTAVEPLWGDETGTIVREFLAMGGEALIVTTRAPLLDESWLGRMLTPDVIDGLVARAVDPCGERGEYHTVVTDAPLFASPLPVRLGRHVRVDDCWAVDVVVDSRQSEV